MPLLLHIIIKKTLTKFNQQSIKAIYRNYNHLVFTNTQMS